MLNCVFILSVNLPFVRHWIAAEHIQSEEPNAICSANRKRRKGNRAGINQVVFIGENLQMILQWQACDPFPATLPKWRNTILKCFLWNIDSSTSPCEEVKFFPFPKMCRGGNFSSFTLLLNISTLPKEIILTWHLWCLLLSQNWQPG